MSTRLATHATLHDGSRIAVVVEGTGPAVVVPVRHEPHDAAIAEGIRAWGGDPDAGPALIAGLADRYRVIAADYEGHRMANPAPGTLTPDALAADALAIADAGGAGRFAWYGYSWLALTGLQVALRTDRLSALAMGGFPPIDGPYGPMLAVTRAAHAASVAAGAAPADETPVAEPTPGDWDTVAVRTTEAQTGQFVTMYEALADFDDRSVLGRLDIPRLAFAGAADRIEYAPIWGDTVVDLVGPLVAQRATLERAGWAVQVVPGLDHLGAMAAAVVVPLLGAWLDEVVAR